MTQTKNKTKDKTKNKTQKVKKERSHSIETTKRVAVAIAKNPSGTLREIAKEAGVGKSTVDRKMGQVGQIKEKWLEDLLSVDIQIIKSATNEINRRINDEEEKKQIKATELSQIAQHSTDRYMKFRGDATDEKGGLKDLSNLAPQELERQLNILLGR